MKYFILILVVSLFSLSCEERETIALSKFDKHCDSLNQIIGDLRKQIPLVGYKFYVISSENILLKKRIITRVSGISLEHKLHEKVAKRHFSCEHISEIDTLYIPGNNIKIVGHFNPNSYVIEGDDKKNILIIIDKFLFWEYSNSLVISYK